MLEIKVDVRFPDLPAILDAIRTFTVHAAAPAPAEAPVPAPAEAPVAAPVAPVSASGPAPVFTPRAPAAAPVAPTAAPTYTLAQVAKAGADLLTADASLQPKLLELLQSFGASTVRDLPQDKLGDFARALRGLGAKI